MAVQDTRPFLILIICFVGVNLEYELNFFFQGALESLRLDSRGTRARVFEILSDEAGNRGWFIFMDKPSELIYWVLDDDVILIIDKQSWHLIQVSYFVRRKTSILHSAMAGLVFQK